jgi:hypothetical protein
MATKYTKWPQNIPNGLKIYQHLPMQDPPKFTEIEIFGLKIYHLANPAMLTKYEKRLLLLCSWFFPRSLTQLRNACVANRVTGSQSYDFGTYNCNASVAIG